MVNEFMSCQCSTTPVAGMMGTMFVGSDRYKVVCVKVLSPKRVLTAWLGDFPVKTVDGLDYYDGDVNTLYSRITQVPGWANAEHMTEEDIKELIQHEIDDNTYTLRQNGRWIKKGSPAHSTGAIHWGKADEYRDPSF